MTTTRGLRGSSVGRLLVLALLLALTAPACATNPVSGKREFTLMSEAQEIELGQQSDEEVRKEMGLYDDPALQRYVSDIGLKLAASSERPNLPWHFAVVDVAAVNAFALPGGYIYITRGILPFLDDEAQLAGVLGHEIGHVTARHAAQSVTRATLGELGVGALGVFVPQARPFGQFIGAGLSLAFLKNSRDDELQADRLGTGYAAKVGWHPNGVPLMLTTLGRMDQAAADRRGIPNWLSTHPMPADRVQKVEATVKSIESLAPNQAWRVEREAYLRRVDGLIFGDNPKDGIARGDAFLHPVLRFAVTFPSGWEIGNSPSQVVAKDPNGNRFMLLQLVRPSPGQSLHDTATAGMATAGFQEVQGGQGTINGLQAYVGTYQGQMRDVGPVQIRAAHIVQGQHVYLLAGLTTPDLFRQAEPLFAQGIQSFRPMGASEAAAIRPNLVSLYVARPGDTWVSIAQRSGGLVSPANLAIMNDHAPADPPRAGERLKIVVAG
jgi:predicted Zn-dependent protease